MNVPRTKDGDKVLSSKPLNHAVKVRRIKKGEKFSTKIEGGFRSRPVDHDGVVAEDAEGTEIYVPASFLIFAGWSAPHE